MNVTHHALGRKNRQRPAETRYRYFLGVKWSQVQILSARHTSEGVIRRPNGSLVALIQQFDPNQLYLRAELCLLIHWAPGATAEMQGVRTKRLILEICDAMAQAESAGVPYAWPFDEAGKW